VSAEAALQVNPYNVNEIKNGLRQLLFDVHLRQKLIRLGKKRAQAFSWENAAKSFIEVFEDIGK
jgi:glycosyltransferase involved in cell wall biosynthesis